MLRGGSCYAMRTKLLQCHVLCWVSAISALLSPSTATWQVHSRREEEASAAAFLLLALDHHIVSCRLTWSASVSCRGPLKPCASHVAATQPLASSRKRLHSSEEGHSCSSLLTLLILQISLHSGRYHPAGWLRCCNVPEDPEFW